MADNLPALVDRVIDELLEQPQADCPVVHYFSPGICVREVSMPAGVLAVGHYQKYPHLNIMLKGRVRMLDDDGGVVELCAPLMYVGQPGRKVGVILEDMVWQNIYATDLTDPDAVEEYFIDKREGFDSFAASKLLPAPEDDDYEQCLIDLGYTQDMVDAECLRSDDLIPFPFGSIAVQVGKSAIHGKGLFATANIEKGTMIPARINDKRTPAGRYINHAKHPNCEAVDVNGDVYMRALRDIHGNKGGLLGEELTADYRQVFRVARGEKICQQQ